MGVFRRRIFRIEIPRIKGTGFEVWVTAFIYLLWLIEFIQNGGIPLFQILLNQEFDYRFFGIRHLHVFAVTFSSLYTVYLFHLFLSTRRKKFLYLYLINLLAGILIFNRGMVLFNVSSSLFLFTFLDQEITWRVWIIITIAGIALLFGFGVLGTLRSSHKMRAEYSRDVVFELIPTTERFRESVLPKEFLWTYIYVASPVANLQLNLNQEAYSDGDFAFFKFLNNELLIDAISKRINLLSGSERIEIQQVAPHLNASTVYSRSYRYLSWTGLVLMFAAILSFAPIYFRMLNPLGPYFGTSLAILCTFYLFLIFDNMFSFTGLAFQLVYAPAFQFFGWINRKLF